jgi:hypothetical protein
VDIGPLADFSQLTGFEDALAAIEGASGITIRSFAAGRATVTMTLSVPVELVAELRRRTPFGFSVRHARPDAIILDTEAADSRHAA